jgi:hypothetical protein
MTEKGRLCFPSSVLLPEVAGDVADATRRDAANRVSLHPVPLLAEELWSDGFAKAPDLDGYIKQAMGSQIWSGRTAQVRSREKLEGAWRVTRKLKVHVTRFSVSKCAQEAGIARDN